MHDWLSICMDRPNQVFPKFCRDVWFPEKTSLIITFVRYYLRTFEGTFVDYLFAKWEGFEVRRYGYHQCLPRSSHGYYLFLWGIDAIICSPLMTCSCTRHSLVFSLSGRFTDCFLALSCPLGSKTKGTTFGNHRAGSYTIRPLFIWCERKCITFERR